MEKLRLIKILIGIIIVIIIFVYNPEITNSKQEISSLEIIKVVGMDYSFEKNDDVSKSENLNSEDVNIYSDNNVKAQISTIIKRNKQDGENANGTGSSNGSKEVFSFSAPSFSTAVATMQTYTSKSIPGSHIQFFILGDNVVNYDVMKTIDFIARNNEVRLNSRIYAIKDMQASEFLTLMINENYELDEKLANLEEENEFLQRKMVQIKTSDVLEANYSDIKAYLIPTLKVKGNNGDVKNYVSNKNGEIIKNENIFNFDGYTIINEGKKIGYLESDKADIYNILVNKSEGMTIDLLYGNNVVSFGIVKSKTNYSFEFENDKLKSVEIMVKLLSNYEECDSKDRTFDESKIEEYQKMQEEIVTAKINEILEIFRKTKVDFLKINNKCEVEHPYKFRKIKDNWNQSLLDAQININVKCAIKRTYDVISTVN